MEPLAIKARNLDVDFEVFSDRRASLKSRFIERGANGRTTCTQECVIRCAKEDRWSCWSQRFWKSTFSLQLRVLPLTNGELLPSDEHHCRSCLTR